MPQGRRKTPFSGKAKKEQLKSKKHSKNQAGPSNKVLLVQNQDEDEEKSAVHKLNLQPGGGRNTNR